LIFIINFFNNSDMNSMMNLQHLKFFYDAVVLNSISEAAKKNFVTQSTISQGITKLEKTLGVDLISHARQRFQVTEVGVTVFESAKHIFQAIHDMHDKITSRDGKVAGDLHFVCTNSLGMSFIDRLYKRMQERYPEVNLKIQLGGLHQIRTALTQGFAELGIVVYDSSFALFQKETVVKGQFGLYQSTKSPKKPQETGILVDSQDGPYVADLIANGFKLQAELGGWEVVARFTDQGIGVGFFPDYLLWDDRYPAIKAIKSESFEYEISAIYAKGHRLSRAALAFIDVLKGA